MLINYFIKIFSYINLIICISSQEHQKNQQDDYNKQQQQQHDLNLNKLLLISINGFRNDYINRYNMQNLINLINDGVSAVYLKPQFITQTLTTHWSMVTGLYPESHGLISTNFYDPDYNDNFRYNSHSHGNNRHDLKWWNQTEPIWYTAVKEGLKCVSFFWPGGNVKYSKTISNLYKSIDHNDSISFDVKVDQTIKWLVRDNYNFIALYHNQLDSISHRYGISSLEFNSTIKEIDNSIGYLLTQLKTNNLYDNKNFHLIILSGHGMVDVKKHVFLDDYINFSKLKIKLVSMTQTSAQIKIEQNVNIDEIMDILNQINYIKAYTKETIPEKWHLKNSNRISDIFIIANEGVNIYLKTQVPKHILDLNLDIDKFESFFKLINDKANHGYDNSLDSMKTIFIAKSSLLKKNYKSTHHIEQVDVYPLVCNLLNIKCNPNNGSLTRIKHFLYTAKSSPYLSSSSSSSASLSSLSISLSSLIYLYFVSILLIYMK